MKDDKAKKSMKFFTVILITFKILFFQSARSNANVNVSFDKINLTKSDHIIAEHLLNMIKFAEKGYINQEILLKVIRETEKSKNFSNFVPWLNEIYEITKIKNLTSLLSHCRNYLEKKQALPLERALEKISGNYCRERSLEAISRDIEKNKTLSDDSTLFIQQNLKFFLKKKNKKNFSYFLQSQATRPEILKKLSQEVTSYSVRHGIIPSHDVLKDIELNEQITKLIQDKGFNPLQHQNVFYSEFGKLIELNYKVLEGKPAEDKIREHYKFIKNYLELNEDHLPVSLCLSRLNDFSKAVFRNGYKDLSRDIFKYIIKKNNKSINEDAQFFYLWTYLYTNEYKEAKKVAREFGLLKNNATIVDARLKFWIAVIHEELGEQSEAIKIYEDIIFTNSLSYYGIMANKKIQFLKPDSPAVPFYVNNTLSSSSFTNLNMKDLDDDHVSSLVRLKAWATIDSARMLKLELKRLNNHSMPSFLVKNATEKQLYLRSDLHLLNARIIQNSQNYLATFRYLYEVLDRKEVIFNRELLEILYPQPYLDLLQKNVKKEVLDPIILLSLIRQESVFNPEAKSRVGARGLMQLMPKTAMRYKRSVNDKQLVNPVINIDIGTKYFNTLMKRYNGNLVYVLAAYNAGEARVERWKNQYFDSNDTILKNIESIPFLETRNYVKLIFRNIFFYKLLLERKDQIADSREANRIFDIHLGFNK